MRKGISLITLIITIVVVIILAAAVILALSGNNPINNARIANLISTKDSMESGVLAYTSKIKAKTLGVVDTYEAITGTNTEDSYRIIEKNDEGLVTCEVTKDEQVITLYKIDKDLFKQNVDKLPSTPNNKCEWYLDEEGHVFLVFEENGLAPKWMTNKQKVIDDATLLTFVVYKGGEIGEGVNSGKVETPKEEEWYDKVQEADADWFTYSNNSDGTVTITGFSSAYPGTPTDIKFPTKNKDKKVINKIGNSAFKNNSIITKIYIPEGFEEVGNGSFNGCNNLNEVYLPSTLTTITAKGNTADTSFILCRNIEKITIPQYVCGSEINASRLFYHSVASIKEVKFSGEITSIGNNVFSGFSSLEKIVLPDTIKEIGDRAFYGCKTVENFKLPSSLEKIGNFTFGNCSNLNIQKFPSSLKEIGNNAFDYCTSLEKIILPEGFKSIGSGVFRACDAIKEVYLPSTLTTITAKGNTADTSFILCRNIEKVTIPQYVCGSEINASRLFYHSVASIKEVAFSGIITSIGNNAFSGFSSLEKIVLPDTITEIGDRAFYGCKVIGNLKLPSSLEKIGNFTFGNCSNLNIQKFPSSLKEIGNNAFDYCTSLEKIILPEGFKSIGSGVFRACDAIKEVYLPSTLTTITAKGNTADTSFILCRNIEKVTIPQYVCGSEINASRLFYHSVASIKEVAFSGIITSIGNNAFSGFSSLEKIVLPDTITEIGDRTFYGCKVIGNLKFPSSLEKIGNFTFGNCSNLDIDKFPNKLKQIGNNSFDYCTSLKKIILPEGLESIGTGTFRECNAITEVYLPSTLTTITAKGNTADTSFILCRNIEKVTIPQTVCNLDGLAKLFYHSQSKIKEIHIDKNVTQINSKLFSGFSNIDVHFSGDVPEGSPWGANGIDIIK